MLVLFFKLFVLYISFVSLWFHLHTIDHLLCNFRNLSAIIFVFSAFLCILFHFPLVEICLHCIYLFIYSFLRSVLHFTYDTIHLFYFYIYIHGFYLSPAVYLVNVQNDIFTCILPYYFHNGDVIYSFPVPYSVLIIIIIFSSIHIAYIFTSSGGILKSFFLFITASRFFFSAFSLFVFWSHQCPISVVLVLLSQFILIAVSFLNKEDTLIFSFLFI